MVRKLEDKKLDLLINILKESAGGSKLKNSIERLETLVGNKFVEILKKARVIPIDSFFDFQNINSDLKEFAIFPPIFDKTIIGIGGCFSSGKSAFINSILEEKLLPTNTVITTSFPTYIMNGKINRNIVLNSFQGRLQVVKDELKKLSHSFYDEYGIHLSHIVDRIFIENNLFKYENLALLDTPGFSADGEGGEKDREIAHTQLRRVEYVIWLSDIATGGLKEDEIEFIRSLGENKRIFFVINKSDINTSYEERKEIYEHIKEQIEDENFNSEGLCLYSSQERKVYSGDDINKFLKKVDDSSNFNFLENIAKVFKDTINSIDSILISNIETNKDNKNSFIELDKLSRKLKEMLKEEYDEGMSESVLEIDKTISILNSVQKEMNIFILDYVENLQEIFENIEDEFSLRKGRFSRDKKLIELENLRVKISKIDSSSLVTSELMGMTRSINKKVNYDISISERKEFKVESKEEPKNYNRTTKGIETNVVQTKKSVARKNDDIAKEKYFSELIKIFKENIGG